MGKVRLQEVKPAVPTVPELEVEKLDGEHRGVIPEPGAYSLHHVAFQDVLTL